MLKIGVLVSGGGTNLQALLNRIEDGYLKECSIVTVVSNRTGAYALERAQNYGIPGATILKKGFGSQKEYDRALIGHLERYGVELVVTAGFLAILGEDFVQRYCNRIINIHPSLIPAFCGDGYYGLIPHRKALEYGVKVTGATVHFIDCETDGGPIILQRAVTVEEGDTPEILQKRVMEQAEWELLPEAVKLYSEGRLVVEGRTVHILGAEGK